MEFERIRRYLLSSLQVGRQNDEKFTKSRQEQEATSIVAIDGLQ